MQQRILGFRLNSANHKAIALATDPGNLRERQKFADVNKSYREKAIARWYKEGGNLYLSWVKKYYRTWSGEPLRWDDPFSEDLFLLIGNPWLTTLYAEKPAQVGWTEAVIAFNAFILSEIRVPVGFGVEKEMKLGDIVGPRVQPAFDHCEPIQKLKSKYKDSVGRKDTDTKQRHITVAGILSTYFYASTTSGANKKGSEANRDRQAPSALSSFTAYILICDEIELWPDGALDVATKRQEACTLPTKPLRAGSTPGQAGGIVDNLLKGSKYLFQWRFVCPHCNVADYLDAFGNLLKPVIVDDHGISEERYIDIRGKPLDWFYKDPKDKEGTAYVGCRHCNEELPKETINAGKFVCRNTGIELRKFLEEATKRQEPVIDDVALRLPKLATTKFNASERIRKLQYTRNPADEIQQGLGKPVSIGGGRINLEFILRAIARDFSGEVSGWEEQIVVGCDQGQASNYLVVTKYWLPPDYEDETDRWYRAIAQILHYEQGTDGATSKFGSIESLVEQFGANIVGMDMKPEVSKAGEYGRLHPPDDDESYPVFLFDQCELGSGQKYRRVPKNIQGVETSVFRLDRTGGLDAVRDRFYNEKISLPNIEYSPKDQNNFIYHLQTSEKLSSGKWVELPGEPDHYFHGLNFCEMALLCWLHEKPKKFAFGGIVKN